MRKVISFCQCISPFFIQNWLFIKNSCMDLSFEEKNWFGNLPLGFPNMNHLVLNTILTLSPDIPCCWRKWWRWRPLLYGDTAHHQLCLDDGYQPAQDQGWCERCHCRWCSLHDWLVSYSTGWSWLLLGYQVEVMVGIEMRCWPGQGSTGSRWGRWRGPGATMQSPPSGWRRSWCSFVADYLVIVIYLVIGRLFLFQINIELKLRLVMIRKIKCW